MVHRWGNRGHAGLEPNSFAKRSASPRVSCLSARRYLPDAGQAIAQVLGGQAAFKADHAMIATNLYRDLPSGCDREDLMPRAQLYL